MATYEMTWKFTSDSDERAAEIVRMLRSFESVINRNVINEIRLTKVIEA